MKLDFIKMHGCGNDYIYFNCTKGPVVDPHGLDLFWLCDRHKGIGADGIVVIAPSNVADARMIMFNTDGSEGMMCGNAIRCVAQLISTGGDVNIETASGVRHIGTTTLGHPRQWTVDMGKATITPSETINVDNKNWVLTRVHVGNPHAVIFLDKIENLDLGRIGPMFEHHTAFAPSRTNTEFVQVIKRNHLKMRVWERGSGETLACGTGACASAVAAIQAGYCDANTDITVDLAGGTLTIKSTDDAVYMTGEAVKVYEGVIEL